MASKSPSRSRAELPGGPPFDAIWNAIAAVPPGDWASYGEIARRAGVPRAARLVGFALRRAPSDRRLPWHRIVGAGGRIALPPGSRARAQQIRLLRAEGVAVVNGRIRSAPASPDAAGLDAMLWSAPARGTRR